MGVAVIVYFGLSVVVIPGGVILVVFGVGRVGVVVLVCWVGYVWLLLLLVLQGIILVCHLLLLGLLVG